MFEFWLITTEGIIWSATENEFTASLEAVPLQDNEYYIYNGSN